MKYFIKVMSLTFVLLFCFICSMPKITAEETGAINIEHAFINDYYPVVGERIYVKVYTSDIFDIPANQRFRFLASSLWSGAYSPIGR